MNRNSLYALVDKKSNSVVAAAATGPPRTVQFNRMSGEEMGENIRIAGMTKAIEILVENLRMKSVGIWQHSVNEKYAPQ